MIPCMCGKIYRLYLHLGPFWRTCVVTSSSTLWDKHCGSFWTCHHFSTFRYQSAGLPACFVDVPVTVVVVFLVFPLGADFYDPPPSPPLPPFPPASFHIALYHLICCSSSFLRPVVASWFVCVSGCAPAPCPLCVPWLPPLRLACLFWSVCSPCLLLPFLLVLMLSVSFSCLMFLACFLCFAFCHSLKLALRFAHALFLFHVSRARESPGTYLKISVSICIYVHV